MVESVSLNIASIGSVQFLRVEWWQPLTKIVLLRYAIDGVEQPLGIRLDLDKKAFLDDIVGVDFDRETQRDVWQVGVKAMKEALNG